MNFELLYRLRYDPVEEHDKELRMIAIDKINRPQPKDLSDKKSEDDMQVKKSNDKEQIEIDQDNQPPINQLNNDKFGDQLNNTINTSSTIYKIQNEHKRYKILTRQNQTKENES